MKSLRAFWHWVDNERPTHLDCNSFRHLSDLADQALDIASDAVGERVGRPHVTVDQLREHWPALRDLSIEICRALEKMHELVPEAVARPSDAPGWFFDEMLSIAYPPDRCEREQAMVDELTKSRAFEQTFTTPPVEFAPTGFARIVTCEAMPLGRVLGRAIHPGSCNCPPCHDEKNLLVARDERGKWMTEQQLAMQRAAPTGDITQRAGGTSYPTGPKRLEPPVGAD